MSSRIAIALFLALLARGIRVAGAADASGGISQSLQQALQRKDAALGNPVLIRVFKRPQKDFDQNPSIQSSFDPHPNLPAGTSLPDISHEYLQDGPGVVDQWDAKHGQVNSFSQDVGELQVWIRSSSGEYVKLKSYPIHAYSGTLGPKQKQGDYQVPEGFYNITEDQLNPHSQYVEAMNVGYPNEYDKDHAAKGVNLGGEVEIHGKDLSMGCMAMGNSIKDIYSVVSAALKYQHSVPVEILPFPLTDANLSKIPDSPPGQFDFKGFWKQLQPGYEAFEQDHLPPTVSFDSKGGYVFNESVPEQGPVSGIQNVGVSPSCADCAAR